MTRDCVTSMIRLVFRLMLSGITLWIIGLGVYLYYVQTMKPYEGTAEAIVVLTGGEGRVETGLNLLAHEKGKRLLISGVNKDVRLKDLLKPPYRDQGLESLVDLGFVAQNTLGNADETREWVERYKIQSIIVVTSNYHMPRALLHLGVQLPDVALYAYPVKSRAFRYRDWAKDKLARRLIIDDYNKFLLTYPQILFLKEE